VKGRRRSINCPLVHPRSRPGGARSGDSTRLDHGAHLGGGETLSGNSDGASLSLPFLRCNGASLHDSRFLPGRGRGDGASLGDGPSLSRSGDSVRTRLSNSPSLTRNSDIVSASLGDGDACSGDGDSVSASLGDGGTLSGDSDGTSLGLGGSSSLLPHGRPGNCSNSDDGSLTP
jgi:hypothetical protein